MNSFGIGFLALKWADTKLLFVNNLKGSVETLRIQFRTATPKGHARWLTERPLTALQVIWQLLLSHFPTKTLFICQNVTVRHATPWIIEPWILKEIKTRKTGGNFARSFGHRPAHFLLQFGGNKQKWISLCGKNKRLKSIVKTEKKQLKTKKRIQIRNELSRRPFPNRFESGVGFTNSFWDWKYPFQESFLSLHFFRNCLKKLNHMCLLHRMKVQCFILLFMLVRDAGGLNGLLKREIVKGGFTRTRECVVSWVVGRCQGFQY